MFERAAAMKWESLSHLEKDSQPVTVKRLAQQFHIHPALRQDGKWKCCVSPHCHGLRIRLGVDYVNRQSVLCT